MAEKLEIVATVKVNDQAIAELSSKVDKAKQSLIDMTAQFGAGSAEAKKAADEVAKLNGQLAQSKQSAEGIDEPIKSMKAQLKEANNELLQTNEQYQKNIAKIKDAKTLTDAFNPDAKFKGLGNAIQGATGALTAITGAQALFGTESKAVQETLLKVQGAMAFSQGINSVLESKDAFKALYVQISSLFVAKQADVAVTAEQVVATEAQAVAQTQVSIVQKIVTAGQWLWNAAMAANPIGAIVAAIAALIAGIVLLVSYFKSSAAEARAQAKAVADNKKEVEALSKALSKNNQELETNQAQQLAMAKASGKSAEEIRKLEIKLADEKIAFERSNRAIASNTRTKELNYLATLKQNGASDETIAAQQKVVESATEIVNKQTELLDKAKKERVDIANKQAVEVTQAATDGAAKRREQAKTDGEKSKQDEKELAAKRVEFDKATNELIAQNKINAIKDEFERRKAESDKQFNDEKAILDAQLLSKEIDQDEYNAKLGANKIKYADINAKITADQQAKELEKIKKFGEQQLIIDDLVQQNRINSIKDANDKRDALVDDAQQKEIDALLKSEDDKLITHEQYLQKRKELDEKYGIIRQSNNEADAKKEFDTDFKKLDDASKNSELGFEAMKDANAKERELIDAHYKDKAGFEQEYTAAVAANTAQRKAINRAELNAKIDYVKRFGEILGGLADVIGRGTKLGKKAAIASLIIEQGVNVAKITMNTIDSTKAIATKYAKIPGGQIPAAIEIGLNIAQGAISIAKSVQAAKKGITDINAAGGGGGADGAGGGGASGGDTSTGGGGAAPIPPQADQTALPQDQINQLATANAATRAYVLESDVSGNQERITRINRAARIN